MRLEKHKHVSTIQVEYFYQLLYRMKHIVQALNDLGSIWHDEMACIHQFYLLAEFVSNQRYTSYNVASNVDPSLQNPNHIPSMPYVNNSIDTDITDSWLFVLAYPTGNMDLIKNKLLDPFNKIGKYRLHQVLRNNMEDIHNRLDHCEYLKHDRKHHASIMSIFKSDRGKTYTRNAIQSRSLYPTLNRMLNSAQPESYNNLNRILNLQIGGKDLNTQVATPPLLHWQNSFLHYNNTVKETHPKQKYIATQYMTKSLPLVQQWYVSNKFIDCMLYVYRLENISVRDFIEKITAIGEGDLDQRNMASEWIVDQLFHRLSRVDIISSHVVRIKKDYNLLVMVPSLDNIGYIGNTVFYVDISNDGLAICLTQVNINYCNNKKPDGPGHRNSRDHACFNSNAQIIRMYR
jgi:hypothetical protein